MKAYLLIFFFLLFYSIKSTELSHSEVCKVMKRICINNARRLIKIGNSLYNNRKAQCEREYAHCMKKKL